MLSNAFNNVDNTWLFGEWWMGPVCHIFIKTHLHCLVDRYAMQWNGTTAGPKTQVCAIALLSAALNVDVTRSNLVAKQNALPTGTITISGTVPIPSAGASVATEVATGESKPSSGSRTFRINVIMLGVAVVFSILMKRTICL